MRQGFAVCWAMAVAIALLATQSPSWAAEYKPPAHHRNVENIARDIAYRGGNTSGGLGMSADPELREELERRNLRFKEGIDDGNNTGMQAMVLEDKKSGQTYIAFRGTWPNRREGPADGIADADPNGDTGSVQYNPHRERLAEWARKYPNSIVTGHSLGAALGQRFISEHPSAVREGVLFNAPAIATPHAERFARSEKQPPVTTYIGRTKVDDGTSAPEYDIVSELGGQSHLPGKIVEVTRTDPHSGITNVLGTSHTATMLSGNAPRTMEEISYEDYQHRREQGWSNTLSTLRGAGDAVWLGIPAAAAAIWRATNFAKERFGGGPVEPTPGMVESAARDCEAAAGYVGRAQRAIQGSITPLKISNAETNLIFARDRSTGCPDVRTRIAGVQGAIGAATEAARNRLQGSVNTCNADSLREVANQAQLFSDKPKFDAIRQQAADRLGRIDSARTAFESARTAYKAGDLDGARTSLNSAKAGLGGDVSCTELAGKIDTALGKIDRLQGALDDARGAVGACAPGRLAALQSEYGAVTHPAMQTILRQASAGAAAHAAYQQARASFGAGDLASAKAELRRAQQRLAAVDSGACADIRDKISRAQAKVDKLQDAIAAAEQSVVSCNTAAMTRWRARFAKVINPAARAVKTQLEKGEQACKERQREERIADAGKRCKASFGTLAVADPKTEASDDPKCACVTGYRWNDNQTACVKAPSEAELAAARNAWCKNNRGSGYYAGRPDSRGQYYCLPTKTTANANCRATNPGIPGVYGHVNANGSVDCRMTMAGLHRSCQINNKNRSARAKRVNGRWICYIPGQRRTVTRQQPSISSQDIATGMAIVGGIISGMQQSGHSERRTPYPRITPQRQPRNTLPTQRRAPARCFDGKFVNRTDPRCSRYW